MGRKKKKQIPNRLPINLDDLIPSRNVNGGTPSKEIFGILHKATSRQNQSHRRDNPKPSQGDRHDI